MKKVRDARAVRSRLPACAQRDLIGDEAAKFFYPFTTTLLVLRLNREPLPLSGANRITGFLEK